ncbi:unnamed protein product [Ixodes pacificus]
MHMRRNGTSNDNVKFSRRLNRLVVEKRHSTGERTEKKKAKNIQDKIWLNRGRPSLCSMLSAVLFTIVIATQTRMI